ncbi:MAG: fibronectin type III domain-containing protein, partial [Candidatus Omnitrophota bacterium]
QPTVPSAPSNLTASVVSSSQINLAWTDNSNNEDGFKIERTSSSTAFVQIATVGAGVTSYQDANLTANTTYNYRVRAYNAAGDSGYSNTASATTQAAQPTVPNAPSNLIATAASTNQIDLSWQDNSANESGFKIERGAGSNPSSFSQIAVVSANVTSYSNTSLTVNTTYTYRVRAYNNNGNSGYSNTATATTLAQGAGLSAPSGLTATAVSNTQIDLRWTDNSSNEQGFKIERGTGSNPSSFSQIATVGANVTSYSNTALSAGSTYTYRVRAYSGSENSTYSNTATATTAASAAPNPPSNLTARAISNSRIDLTWTDNSNNESGFKIERGAGANPTSWSQIAVVSKDVTSYSNTSLVKNTTYSYRLRAYNQSNSEYSNMATATTLP